MRAFRDEAGIEWDVMVGRESWGTVVAIFVARGEAESPLQAFLTVSSAEDGNRLLMEMSEEELRALLKTSVPKSTE